MGGNARIGCRRRKQSDTIGGVRLLAALLLATSTVLVASTAQAEPVEEMPALAVDDTGQAYLLAVETDADGKRAITVDAIKGTDRIHRASLAVTGATGLGRPSAVGLARGVLVAWATRVPGGAYRLAVARVGPGSTDTPRVLPGDGVVNILPAIARSGDRVGLVWETNADPHSRTVRFGWMEADGSLAGEATLSSPGWNSGNPDLVATANGALFAVWESFRDDGYDLFGAWYRDGRWGPERRLTTDPRIDRHGRLASRGNAVWLAWESSAYTGNEPLDVRDHEIVVARVAPGGSLRETARPFERTALVRPTWPTAHPGHPDPQFQTGLFHPYPAIDADGRVWVTARQAVDRHGGWGVVVRHYAGDAWSAATVPLARPGRWHVAPLAALAGGVIVAVQHDDQPTTFARRKVFRNWRSRIDLRRLPADGPAPAPQTVPLTHRPGDFDVQRRRHASNAGQARQTRRHGGRTLQLFWGNLHAHSAMSVCNRAGNPPPRDVLTIERDLDGLDFCALTDHGFSLDVPMWRYQREVVAQYRDPGRFLTLLGEEWASSTVPPAAHGHPGEPLMMRYGHHNIIFAGTDVPRFFDSAFGPLSPAAVAAELGKREYIIIPHGLADWQMHGLANPPVDWSNTDEVHEPLAEIYQRRGSYECLGCPLASPTGTPFAGHYLQDAWAAGIVIGVIAATDHGGGEGYAGVWATGLNEHALFEAFHARHTFGTTGEKIALFVSSGEAMMGDKTRRPEDGRIPLQVSVAAGAPIEKVEILRNNEVVHVQPGGGDSTLDFHWTDEQPPDAPALWYYVRATVVPDPQESIPRDRLAWSSPIWFFDSVPPPRRFEPVGGAATP
jgi:hypothetical protein